VLAQRPEQVVVPAPPRVPVARGGHHVAQRGRQRRDLPHAADIELGILRRRGWQTAGTAHQSMVMAGQVSVASASASASQHRNNAQSTQRPDRDDRSVKALAVPRGGWDLAGRASLAPRARSRHRAPTRRHPPGRGATAPSILLAQTLHREISVTTAAQKKATAAAPAHPSAAQSPYPAPKDATLASQSMHAWARACA
jgi:hypothetical protein